MASFYKNNELQLFMQVVSEKTGSIDRAIRVHMQNRDHRFEYYTFGQTTIDYINAGLAYGNVVEIEETEFKDKAKELLAWTQEQISKL